MKRVNNFAGHSCAIATRVPRFRERRDDAVDWRRKRCHSVIQLYVRKGQTGVNIDVGQARGGGAKELQAEKGLAALAVSRL